MLKILTLSFRNNDGFITKQEMLNTTSKLTAKQVWQINKWKKEEKKEEIDKNRKILCVEKVSAVFDRNDKDGDDKLSKEEFKEMMMREKKGKSKDKEKKNS